VVTKILKPTLIILSYNIQKKRNLVFEYAPILFKKSALNIGLLYEVERGVKYTIR
jgi:hypothetical protein